MAIMISNTKIWSGDNIFVQIDGHQVERKEILSGDYLLFHVQIDRQITDMFYVSFIDTFLTLKDIGCGPRLVLRGVVEAKPTWGI